MSSASKTRIQFIRHNMACQVLWQALMGAITLLAPVAESFAEAASTYPGVIISNRSTPQNEASVETAAASVRFSGVSAERLAPGAVHVREKALPSSEVGPRPVRRNLCRTARVRRIIKQAKGHITCSQNYELATTTEPNDPSYATTLWGLQMMAAPAAWDVTTGRRDAIVAVVDTGISHSHPDLRGNLWVNPKEVPFNSRDDDGNGFIDDVHGANAITKIGSGSDDNSHGSHVAGTIGATGNNATGAVGVNWNVSLMSVKFLSASGSGSTADAIRAIQYVTTAKQNGQNIIAINSSWGGSSFSKPLLDAINAAGASGILFVASAGNSGRSNDVSPSYPASYSADNIIAVAAVNPSGSLSFFSNYGANSVHIGAPGWGIYSTVLNDSYESMSGTSMAAPHVAGLAALAYAACPSLSMRDLKAAILSNGIKKAELSGKLSTGSIANAAGTILTASANCPSMPLAPTATPRQTNTPTPTPRPTNTPIMTPTPTPTPPPLPAGGYLRAEPSTIASGSPGTLKISAGRSTPSAVSLRYRLTDLNGKSYECRGTTTVTLPQGARTVQLALPTEAKYFTSIRVSFATPAGSFSTSIFQTGTQLTASPRRKAARLCRALSSKPIL